MTEHDTIHEIMLVSKAFLHYPQCGGITLARAHCSQPQDKKDKSKIKSYLHQSML